MQGVDIQLVLDKGLRALSVQELGRLLSQLGLGRFVTEFKQMNVSDPILIF